MYRIPQTLIETEYLGMSVAVMAPGKPKSQRCTYVLFQGLVWIDVKTTEEPGNDERVLDDFLCACLQKATSRWFESHKTEQLF